MGESNTVIPVEFQAPTGESELNPTHGVRRERKNPRTPYRT